MNTYENTTINSTMVEIMNALSKTADISLRNTESTAVVLKRLENNEDLMRGLSTTMDRVSTDLTGVKGEIENLKLNEEVTTTQQETIIETATKRIVEILGNEPLERQKYFRIFIGKLYKDTRQSAGLGSKIARTKKGDFQRVIDHMEAWIPKCGCIELKNKADRNAEARKIAKQEGYLN